MSGSRSGAVRGERLEDDLVGRRRYVPTMKQARKDALRIQAQRRNVGEC